VSAALAAQGLLSLAVLLGLGAVLGSYLAAVYTGRVRFLAPVARAFLRTIGAQGSPQDRLRYTRSLLLLVLLGILLLQGAPPLNPQGFDGVPLAVHTTVSSATSTNWLFFAGSVPSPGTLRTDAATLGVLLVGVSVLPALVLGPVAEALSRGA
jgi:K+-transporting ATPase ATPase A chain